VNELFPNYVIIADCGKLDTSAKLSSQTLMQITTPKEADDENVYVYAIIFEDVKDTKKHALVLYEQRSYTSVVPSISVMRCR